MIRLQTSIQLLCSLCDLPMTSKEADEEHQEGLLFGYKRYATCPCCKREVGDMADPEWAAWKSKVDEWMEQDEQEQPSS